MINEKLNYLEQLIIENNIEDTNTLIIFNNAKFILSQNIQSLDNEIYFDILDNINIKLDKEIKKISSIKNVL